MGEESKSLVKMASRFDELFLPKTKDDLFKLAEMHSKSNLVPACYRGKQADIVIAWSLGMPLGLSMVQCLLGIAVINGRPTLWGDVLNGLVLSQPDLEKFNEEYNKEKDEWTCTIKRKGRDEVVRTFSMEEAKTAGLYPGKDGSAWKKYPKRMIQMRARGFCIRDSYSDRTSGLNVDTGDLIDVTDSVVITDNPTPKIVDKIAAKAKAMPPCDYCDGNGYIKTGPEKKETTCSDCDGTGEHQKETSTPAPQNVQEYKNIQEVVDNFRAAADIESLKDMRPLIAKVDPAFKDEARTAYNRELENLEQEGSKQDSPEISENELVKKLSVICVGINPDGKAGIAKELFDDGRKKSFRVRELDGDQLHKLRGILEKRGLFQEEE